MEKIARKAQKNHENFTLQSYHLPSNYSRMMNVEILSDNFHAIWFYFPLLY